MINLVTRDKYIHRVKGSRDDVGLKYVSHRVDIVGISKKWHSMLM